MDMYEEMKILKRNLEVCENHFNWAEGEMIDIAIQEYNKALKAIEEFKKIRK